MSPKEQDAIKWHLNSDLAKKFIQASLVSHFLPVFFVKKPRGRIRFCVDYSRLNAITKKYYYPIIFVKKILA